MADSKLQLVLVTPEKTLFDEPVESLRFPLFDGQVGVLPGRAPMVGRLGYGPLKVTTGRGEQLFYIDGGFAQVKGSVVSILTNRALLPADIDAAEAEQALSEASARVPTNELDFANKDRDQERARQMRAMAK